MPRIRVALAGVTATLSRVVRDALDQEADLLLVAEESGEIRILLDVGRADVVIVNLAGGELPPMVERLVDEYPDIGVLGVDLDHGRGLLYRLRPTLVAIDPLSPATLAAAIRWAAGDAAA
ncbi:hypothetical protein [Nonomuraea endophytica]|uniref:Response regulator transcription factor n=1 Tax=Nonomuraea endophytica TaxID=714136 RepID=A0A7W7ZYW7_9ACTN|nr:hypothetical protein [Nonomuraea endophytica]MBB5076372.1 hypothetical protein [Nonomuraea endophytica]